MTSLRLIGATGLLACALSAPLGAQTANDGNLQTAAYRDSITQDQLHVQADQVRQQLAQLLEDCRQNHLSTAESALLQQSIERLARLGDKDMGGVVQTLRQAGALNDAAAAEIKLLQASNEQRGIQTSLKALTDMLTLRQTQESMQLRLGQLIARQMANLHRTQDIMASGQPLKLLPHELKFAAKNCVSEQAALRNESSLLVDALEKAAGNGEPNLDNSIFARTLQLSRDRHLDEQAVRATVDTSADDFTNAAHSQEQLLLSLEALAEEFAAQQPVPDRLRDLSTRVKDLAGREETLAQATQAANASDTKEIREQQRQLADQAAVLRDALAGIDVRMGDQLEPAEQAMRSANDLLKSPNALKDAPKNSKSAAAPAGGKAQVAAAQAEAGRQLQAIGATLDKEAGSVAQTGNPANPANAPVADATQALAALQQLGQEVSQAVAQQQALASQLAAPGSAAQQQQLAAQVAAMQRQASPLDTGVANSLGQAALQMQQAQGTQAPEAASQAAASLAQAQAQIGRETQEAAKAAAAEQVTQALVALLTRGKAQVLLAARIIGQPQINDLTPAIEQMNGAQGLIQQALSFIGRGEPALPQELTADLNVAETDLTSSRMQAAQLQKATALTANNHAQAELDAAIRLLQQSAAALIAKALPDSNIAQSQQAAAAQAAGQQSGQQAGQQQSGQQAGQQQSGQQQSGQQQSGQQAGQQQSGQQQSGQQQSGQQAGQQQSGQQAGQQPGSQQTIGQNDDGANDGNAVGGQANDTAKGDHYIPSFGTATGYTLVNRSLNSQDRGAVTLFQKEKVPSEYSEMVQQYTRNLADGQTPPGK